MLEAKNGRLVLAVLGRADGAAEAVRIGVAAIAEAAGQVEVEVLVVAAAAVAGRSLYKLNLCLLN